MILRTAFHHPNCAPVFSILMPHLTKNNIPLIPNPMKLQVLIKLHDLKNVNPQTPHKSIKSSEQTNKEGGNTSISHIHLSDHIGKTNYL